jgi:hypothetical protein
MAGSSCIKKYNIEQHLKNGILLTTIKNTILKKSFENIDNCIVIKDISTILKASINSKYLEFQEKINSCISRNTNIDYYDIVAPFRRLLNDVCYLVTEYNYDFMVLLKEIESNVNSMNNCVKHIIIDEENSSPDLSDTRVYDINENEKTEQIKIDNNYDIVVDE